MFGALLAIIYVSFISLGLPDSLLGAGWPVMHLDFGVSVSLAGVLSTIITCGTIVSSLMSDKLTKRLGTGLVTAISVGMTAISLFGFSVSPSFIITCIIAIPYGLGAGAVDAALNNYVALHYSARHMSWLHCFWGVGASISPYIMGACLESASWRHGYSTVSVIQLTLTVILFIALPLWKIHSSADNGKEIKPRALSLLDVLKIKGVPSMLLAFLGYCAMETTSGLWASTYLVVHRGVDTETAARFASLFFLGITLGRFISGFFTSLFSDKTLIRAGLGIIFCGACLIAIPTVSPLPALIGLIVIGIGGAPVYPSIIHSTPDNFGRENSQAVIGVQMASAYTGSALMPVIFGFIAERISVALYPYYLAIFVLLALAMTERLNKLKTKN